MVIRIEPVLGQLANVAAFPRRAAARYPMAVKSQPACLKVAVNIVSKIRTGLGKQRAEALLQC
jgi:hypothetical protein